MFDGLILILISIQICVAAFHLEAKVKNIIKNQSIITRNQEGLEKLIKNINRR